VQQRQQENLQQSRIGFDGIFQQQQQQQQPHVHLPAYGTTTLLAGGGRLAVKQPSTGFSIDSIMGKRPSPAPPADASPARPGRHERDDEDDEDDVDDDDRRRRRVAGCGPSPPAARSNFDSAFTPLQQTTWAR